MRYVILIVSLLLISCVHDWTPEQQIEGIQGYWEISEVRFPDGTIKSYKASPLIDFITIQDSIGIRKKLSPTLTETYYSTKSQENFTVSFEDQKMLLNYKTPYDSWYETVAKLKDSLLIIRTNENVEYTYQRFNRQININNL